MGAARCWGREAGLWCCVQPRGGQSCDVDSGMDYCGKWFYNLIGECLFNNRHVILALIMIVYSYGDRVIRTLVLNFGIFVVIFYFNDLNYLSWNLFFDFVFLRLVELKELILNSGNTDINMFFVFNMLYSVLNYYWCFV